VKHRFCGNLSLGGHLSVAWLGVHESDDSAKRPCRDARGRAISLEGHRLGVGSFSAGHLPVTSGFLAGLLMSVPPKTATAGAPYCAAFPRLLVVTPAMTSPKFQMHWPLPLKTLPMPWPAAALLVRVQNG